MRKGFSLIETVIAIALLGLLVCTEVTLFVRNNSILKTETRDNKESFYIKEALMFIENNLNKAEYIVVKQGEIETCRHIINSNKITERTEYIKLNSSGTLIIYYYNNGFQSGHDNIIKNLKEFSVKQDENIVNISVFSKSGRRFDRCIPLGIEKREASY